MEMVWAVQGIPSQGKTSDVLNNPEVIKAYLGE